MLPRSRRRRRDVQSPGLGVEPARPAAGAEDVLLRGELDRRSLELAGPLWAGEKIDVDAADVNEALAVNAAEWREELPLIEEWFEFVGEKLPTGIKDEFDALKHRLAEAD